MRWLLLLVVAGCCQTQPVEIKEWSLAEQHQMLAEEKLLPPDSVIVSALEDYARLRRQVQ